MTSLKPSDAASISSTASPRPAWGATAPPSRTTARSRSGSASFRLDRRPLVEGCPCPCCTRYDRAYLRHLFVSEEMLGLRLLSLHNVSFLITLMSDARTALRTGTFDAWSRDWLLRYHTKTASDS